ncbi:hypothetical protein FACS189452_06900 [Bacteroidia bacterium]|nr:hypothetical protein FACS189452_06900 [Bacteroidia bacterium]
MVGSANVWAEEPAQTDVTENNADATYNSESAILTANNADAAYNTESTNLVVYPNPVYNGQLVIDKGQLVPREKVEVFNMFGALVGVHFIGEGQTIINLSGLPNGVYIVRVGNKVAKVRKE